MKISVVLKGLLIAPWAYLNCFYHQDKSFEERYAFVQCASKFIIKFLGYDLQVKYEEAFALEKPIFYVSNHQGTIDPAMIVASSPTSLSFISKKENDKLPLLGKYASLIDTIYFDRSSKQGNIHMLKETLRYLKNGRSILIFPEGTRSKQDQMNPFKEGALKPCYMAKANVVAVALNNAYCLDVKGKHEKRLQITYGKLHHYEEYKDMAYEDFAAMIYQEIAAKVNNCE